MQRFDDWPERLVRFIEERRTRPFLWGANDCCTFAADWVREATGEDRLAHVRGTYGDAAAAIRTLHELGQCEGVAEKLGGVKVDVPFASRGDLALVGIGGRSALGVILGRYVAGPGASGVEFVDVLTAQCAWKV